jgi:hypothetical protein
MLKVSKNPHRWKGSVDDRTRVLLDRCAKWLQRSWDLDKKNSGYYPMNTWMAFMETRDSLSTNSPEVPGKGIKVALAPRPQTLLEFLSEKTISAIYHEQNEGSYSEALGQAIAGDAKSWKKILRAIDASYYVYLYGDQASPTPRNHFLHRNLLEIADLTLLGDLTHEGVVEFFDDMCPCGKKHQPDAVRKLRRRLARRLQAKF